LFTDIVAKSRNDPPRFSKLVRQLFEAMAHGGDFGADTIRHFNGNLFSDGPVLDLTADEMERVHAATELDWSAIDPSILGTLFERGLDPDKRSQLGAHYTSREDIETVVEPVVMQPLRREWAETKQIVANLLATGKKAVAAVGDRGKSAKEEPPSPGAATAKLTPQQLKKARGQADMILHNFLTRLAGAKVLDPACGSGNFLYVTLQKLKDLEKEVILYSMESGIGGFLPQVGPWQLYGIEINPYAYELAQMTVWIGYLQWTRANGFAITQTPILRPMEGNFFCMDAIFDPNGKEPEWPRVDFIVSNPPFLGGKKLRDSLGDEYVDKLFAALSDRVRPEADLCCYWFEKARKHIEENKCQRAGLLATQGIRGGANREVLKRIKESGDIFFAVSDRDWILDGANVHISMVGFDDGSEMQKVLDGQFAKGITAQLTGGSATYAASFLAPNLNISFMGITPAGRFDIEFETGLKLLQTPNPNGLQNSDVIRPYLNGNDLTKRTREQWTIDFGIDASMENSARYEAPFEYILKTVKPERDNNNREAYRQRWWLYAEPRPAMRTAFSRYSRYLATCMVAKHRMFVWLPSVTLPANVVIVFARDDDFFFGMLQSRIHEVWALKLGTRLETRPRYTPTTCFETFPFPEPVPDQQAAIAAAAKELDAMRQNWLNPPGWMREEILEFPARADGPWARYIVPESAISDQKSAIGIARYPRLIPKDADCAKQLAKRTLTNLYNERPTWLALAHEKLDAAVFAAYGWPATLSDDELLAKLLALNLERAKK
ncbi:MAG: class I SAM-dependent DNA methyltransferase, partial [Verrucomicrobia bacterium]|nr:class I SAM-dependent DNA methyltransferase [Verrucomicrobiota bacterium]